MSEDQEVHLDGWEPLDAKLFCKGLVRFFSGINLRQCDAFSFQRLGSFGVLRFQAFAVSTPATLSVRYSCAQIKLVERQPVLLTKGRRTQRQRNRSWLVRHQSVLSLIQRSHCRRRPSRLPQATPSRSRRSSLRSSSVQRPTLRRSCKYGLWLFDKK